MKKLNFKDLIIKESSDYIIINKPPYLSSLDDRFNQENIKSLARGYHPDAQLCHRLDKETSGCLVISKNQEAYRHLAMQFEDRKVTKVYQAVCNGVHDFDKDLINVPLTPLRKAKVRVDFGGGKDSQTYVTNIKAYTRHTYVECIPVTGRMHQIRVHLAYAGAPIVADETYGGDNLYLSQLKRHFNLKKGEEEQTLIKRVALHAYGISFQDAAGDSIEAVADYPKDFAVLIKQLEKYSS